MSRPVLLCDILAKMLVALCISGCGSNAEALKKLRQVAKVEEDSDTGELKIAIVGNLDEALPLLKRVSKVTQLGVTANAGNDVLVHLEGLTELRGLGLNLGGFSRGGEWISGMTDAGLVHLRNMKKLQRLSLLRMSSHAEAKGFAHLADLPALEVLYLDMPLYDAIIENLQGCKQLKRLDTDMMMLSDKGVAALTLLPALEELRMDCSSKGMRRRLLSDANKGKVAELSDAWLAELAKSPRLKVLQFHAAGGLDLAWSKGLQELKAAKPGLKVDGVR